MIYRDTAIYDLPVGEADIDALVGAECSMQIRNQEGKRKPYENETFNLGPGVNPRK